MEFIEKSYNTLVEHLTSNGLEKDTDDFKIIDSIGSFENANKINIFLLGVLLDRVKTQGGNIYKKNKKYEVANNNFEIFYAIKLPLDELSAMSLIVRILSDFEQMDGAKVRLLNSKKELEDTLLVNNFMKVNNISNIIFVKVTISEVSLKNAPVVVPVSDIKLNLETKK